MLVLPANVPGFQRRRLRSPAPLNMWPYPSPSIGSLDLAAAPGKSAGPLPLTPPLTPSSTRRTDSDAHSSRSNSIDGFDPYRDFRHASQWKRPSDFVFPDPALDRCSIPEPSLLPSPTSPTRPRSLIRESDSSKSSSRFLFVGGVPRDASSQELKQTFLPCGDLKGIFVRLQADHGAIVLAFYDIRHTIRAHRQINTCSFFTGAHLQAHFISADELRSLIGQSNFVSANDGSLRIATSPAGPNGALDASALQNVLASFGELRTFAVVDAKAKAYHAEFFDARDATSALGALDGRVILSERIHLAPYTSPAVHESQPPSVTPAADHSESSPASPQSNTIPFPSTPAHRRRLSIDSSLPSLSPPLAHSRRSSNNFQFDCIGKAPAVRSTPPRPRSISDASQAAGLGLVGAEEEILQQLQLPQVTAPPSLPSPPLSLPILVPSPVRPARFGSGGARHPEASTHDRNKIDVAKIEHGDDTRTTVMIKNIPNKMSDKHLLDFINEVAPRKIDFLYLRMDFANGCNVGYAFVNFIHVEDLLHFAKARLGTKWNLFSSEKILGMSYANYQGKEALIDKFRSSSIMDQREAWRPKLFYSSGPKQGLPEPFPAPTHVRRKERSAAAGAAASGGATGTLFHHYHRG